VVQGLVGLLKQHVPSRCPPGPGASVARRAADAITNLAHENVTIKCKVRAEGGVPPLVALLESFDAKVRLKAALTNFHGQLCMRQHCWMGACQGTACMLVSRYWVFPTLRP
jgi:hypothetical protein